MSTNRNCFAFDALVLNERRYKSVAMTSHPQGGGLGWWVRILATQEDHRSVNANCWLVPLLRAALLATPRQCRSI